MFLAWPARTRFVDFLRALQRPLDVDLPEAGWVVDRLPDAEADALGETGAQLIVPIVMTASGAEAMLVLGRKRSDEPFGREDKDLLQTIAESVAPLVDPSIVSRGSPRTDQDAHPEPSTVPKAGADRLILETSPTSTMADTAADGDATGASHGSARWGSFELRQQVGSGSFGTVYLAWDPQLDREIAVKLLKHKAPRLDEGRLLARVRHPNVVTVYGANEFEGQVGIWMEFVRGNIKALIETQGIFGGHEAALVGGVICRALAAVHHAGLLHQDIKAQNVMRERGGRLVLMDFGAGGMSRNAVVPSGGTPIYMAPELFGDTPASAQSDLYAVGVLLFHMTTGAFPVDGRTYAEVRSQHALAVRHRWLRDLRPDLPDRFVAAVERALDGDPSRRFPSAGAMELALAAGDW